MPVRKVSFVSGEFYHVYNRGNSRQEIFHSQTDYDRFSALLYAANGAASIDSREVSLEDMFTFDRGEQQVAIGAYCLMPNHFHILVTPLVEGGLITFMRKLATGYSMYFNKKHHRTGSLFEGRFKSEHVNNDNHLKYLFSYIHLNPVKLIQSKWQQEGIKDTEVVLQYLQDFRHSSYVDNDKIRPESVILNRSKFPEYFSNKKAYDTEMKEWLSLKETDPKDQL
jgi:putative transposase